MEPKKLFDELRASTEALAEALSSFREESFRAEPAPDAWSAAQVAEHLIRLEGLVNQILQGPAQKEEGRMPDEKIGQVKTAFLDFGKKYRAFGPIIPTGEVGHRDDAVSMIRQIRDQMKTLLSAGDLSATCLAFAHPLFGPLTRLEWGYYVIFHCARHLDQLGRIRKGAEASTK